MLGLSQAMGLAPLALPRPIARRCLRVEGAQNRRLVTRTEAAEGTVLLKEDPLFQTAAEST